MLGRDLNAFESSIMGTSPWCSHRAWSSGTAFETEGEVPNIDPELYNALVPAANLTAARVQQVIAGGDVQVVIQDEAGNRYTASTAAKVKEDRSSWKSRVVPETRIVDYSTAQNYLAYIY